jgi:hypothetical protein
MVLCETAQPPLQYYWLRALVKFWNDMPKTDSPLVMSIVQAELDMTRTAGIGWASQLFTAAANLAPALYPSSLTEHVPLDRAGIMQHWLDYWDGRWLQLQGDPEAVMCDNRESATYARWFKGAGSGFKWRDLPHYLSSPLSVKEYKTIARLRLGNHGLHVETGRFQDTDFVARWCQRCEATMDVDDVPHFLFACETTQALRELPEFADIGHDVRTFSLSDNFNGFVLGAFKLLRAAPPAEGAAQAQQPRAGGRVR